MPRALPRRLRPRVVSYQVGGQALLRLILAGRDIGEYDAEAFVWRIRRPFKLLVDERSLPTPVAVEPNQG